MWLLTSPSLTRLTVILNGSSDTGEDEIENRNERCCPARQANVRDNVGGTSKTIVLARPPISSFVSSTATEWKTWLTLTYQASSVLFSDGPGPGFPQSRQDLPHNAVNTAIFAAVRKHRYPPL